MIILGVIAAIISGICIPYMIYLFGSLTRTMVFLTLIQKEETTILKDPIYLALCTNKSALTDTYYSLLIQTNTAWHEYPDLYHHYTLLSLTFRRFINYFNKLESPSSLGRGREIIYTTTDLEDIILQETGNFAYKHALMALLYTVCCSIYFICFHHSSENQVIVL